MESKIAMDRYTNRKILTGTARSIYTIDPQTGSGNEMATFAAHHLPNPAILEDLLQQQSDDKFHRNTIRNLRIKSLIYNSSHLNSSFAVDVFQANIYDEFWSHWNGSLDNFD